MFNGEFIQHNIRLALQMHYEKPVSLIVHYLTGIVLVWIFLYLRKKMRIFQGTKFMGLVSLYVNIVEASLSLNKAASLRPSSYGISISIFPGKLKLAFTLHTHSNDSLCNLLFRFSDYKKNIIF